jgi:hypothetical protein
MSPGASRARANLKERSRYLNAQPQKPFSPPP